MINRCEPIVSVSGGGRAILGRVLIMALALLSFLGAAQSAQAALTVEPGTLERVLTDSEGHVTKRWSLREWFAWEREVGAENQALALKEANAVRELCGIEPCGYTLEEQEAADKVVQAARGEGIALDSQVASDLTFGAEASGELAPALAATALGAVALGPFAFKLGLDIGNGLDEIFGLPTLSEHDEQAHESATNAGCSLSSRPVPGSIGGFEKHVIPAGTYVTCPNLELGSRQVALPTPPGNPIECNSFGTGGTGVPIEGAELEWVPDTTCSASVGARQEVLVERVPDKCDLAAETTKWLLGEVPKCTPLGVPFGGPLNNSQRVENLKNGFPAEPEGGAAPATPSVTPIPSPNPAITRITEHDKTRTFIEKEGEKTPKQLAEKEEEEETIIIPAPDASETATEYASTLSDLGLTNVTVTQVNESNENPSAGPDGVAGVSPNAGSRVKPSTHVSVSENPDDAGPPAEPKSGIGPPTLPGIKFPQLGLLCRSFPFGVPCWLWSEFARWSEAGTAPTLSMEEFEIMGHKIPGGSFNLEPLEPFVVDVRPFILLFSLISIVVTFYKWATGRSGGVSDADDGDSRPTDGSE